LVSRGRRQAGTITRSSGDGRFSAFESEDALLVPGDTNGARDGFVRDRRRTCLPWCGARPLAQGYWHAIHDS
jgi:hypothetical protein